MKHAAGSSLPALADLARDAAKENIMPFWPVVGRARHSADHPSTEKKWMTLKF